MNKNAVDSAASAGSSEAGHEDSQESPAGPFAASERSEQKEESSFSWRAKENTNEFSHALNHLPAEDIPSYTRDFDSILPFPEKFMLMMIYIERSCAKAGKRMEEEAIHWTQNGTVVVIRDPNDLYLKWLRRFFGILLYDSFIRKIYRWGFRKSPPIAYDLPLGCHAFTNPYFRRDQMERLCEMKSTTAAKIRPASKAPVVPLNQIDASKQSVIQASEASSSSIPNLEYSLLSPSHLQPNLPPLALPNQTLLAQQLHTLQLQALLTNSRLSQVRNEAISGTSAIDLLTMRRRLNQSLATQTPSVQELVQLLQRRNVNHLLQAPTALEELLRLLRQYPPR